MPEKTPSPVSFFGATLFFFVLLFVFSKWGPGIPFSINQVTTNRADFFTVSAEGRVQTKPDSAEVSIGFTGSGKTVTDAQTKTNVVMNSVTDAIKKLGISAEDIKTTNYTVNPQYTQGYFPGPSVRNPETETGVVTMESPTVKSIDSAPQPLRGGPPQISGYEVNATIQVKVKDLEKLNQVIDSATKNGANQIHGITFTIANKEKVLSEARKLAITNAKKKASEIASQAGVNLGKIVNVYDNEASPYGGGMMYAAKAVPDANNQTQIESGSTEVVVNVTLNYETK